MIKSLKKFHKKLPAFCIVLFVVMIISCNSKSSTNQASDSSAVKKDSAANILGKPIKYDSSKKYIYLGFDDGPQPPGTTNCMHIFRDQNVKATFFLVGFNAFDERRMRIADTIKKSYPLFLLANHSYTHAFRDHYQTFYSHPDSAVADFIKEQNFFGIKANIIRLPGNSAWVGNDGKITSAKSVRAVAQKLDSLNYNIIGWDLEWGFVKGSTPLQSADEIVKSIGDMFNDDRTHTSNHLVILAHDRMFEKPQYEDSLIKVLSILKKDPTYVFETLDHYPDLKPMK